MEKCSIEPAQGTQARLWPVGKRSKARFLAPAYHQRLTLRAKRGGNAVDQPFALPQRVRLVAAEALRLSAGKDRPQYPQIPFPLPTCGQIGRRRVGKACVGTCRSRLSLYH